MVSLKMKTDLAHLVDFIDFRQKGKQGKQDRLHSQDGKNDAKIFGSTAFKQPKNIFHVFFFLNA